MSFNRQQQDIEQNRKYQEPHMTLETYREVMSWAHYPIPKTEKTSRPDTPLSDLANENKLDFSNPSYKNGFHRVDGISPIKLSHPRPRTGGFVSGLNDNKPTKNQSIPVNKTAWQTQSSQIRQREIELHKKSMFLKKQKEYIQYLLPPPGIPRVCIACRSLKQDAKSCKLPEQNSMDICTQYNQFKEQGLTNLGLFDCANKKFILVNDRLTLIPTRAPVPAEKIQELKRRLARKEFMAAEEFIATGKTKKPEQSNNNWVKSFMRGKILTNNDGEFKKWGVDEKGNRIRIYTPHSGLIHESQLSNNDTVQANYIPLEWQEEFTIAEHDNCMIATAPSTPLPDVVNARTKDNSHDSGHKQIFRHTYRKRKVLDYVEMYNHNTGKMKLTPFREWIEYKEVTEKTKIWSRNLTGLKPAFKYEIKEQRKIVPIMQCVVETKTEKIPTLVPVYKLTGSYYSKANVKVLQFEPKLDMESEEILSSETVISRKEKLSNRWKSDAERAAKRTQKRLQDAMIKGIVDPKAAKEIQAAQNRKMIARGSYKPPIPVTHQSPSATAGSNKKQKKIEVLVHA